MSAKRASTHRLDSDVQAALDHLSQLLHRPKNRLINEAVKLYVEQESLKVEKELSATLTAMRAHRQRDANFEQTIDAFVDAEARLGAADPVEGRPVIVESPVRTKIRRMLNG